MFYFSTVCLFVGSVCQVAKKNYCLAGKLPISVCSLSGVLMEFFLLFPISSYIQLCMYLCLCMGGGNDNCESSGGFVRRKFIEITAEIGDYVWSKFSDNWQFVCDCFHLSCLMMEFFPSFHRSSCTLDCGLDGLCDSVDDTPVCLCPYGRTGSLCNEGKIKSNLV
jgi:hypothetical protein